MGRRIPAHRATSASSTPGGYLRVVDRIKDVIKTGGEWVSSLQIEDLISQREGVSEAAVIGVKDDKWGERPLALVVRDARTGSDLSDTQIKAHLKVLCRCRGDFEIRHSRHDTVR